MVPVTRKTFCMKKTVVISFFVLLLLVGSVAVSQLMSPRVALAPVPTPTVSVQKAQEVSVSYEGVAGKDALGLLQEKAKVELDTSGMVVSIDGKKAQSTKREYWAFYINGEMSQVGPKEYITKDSDKLLWKIATY